jgi:hypothetical protein
MAKITSNNNSAAKVGYEAQLWQMADALSGSTDGAEYKHSSSTPIFFVTMERRARESNVLRRQPCAVRQNLLVIVPTMR